MSATAPPHRSDPRSLVRQSVQAVWPRATSVEITRSVRGRRDGLQEFFVLPSLRSPRWLVPTSGPLAATGTGPSGAGRGRRAGAAVGAMAHRSGLTRRLPVARVRVEPGDRESLLSVLADTLGEGLTVAIRLGAWQDLRSLVVRVHGPRGTTVGFVKMGLDPRGRRSVRAEEAGLSVAAGLGLDRLVAPEVLCSRTWDGHELLVTAPLVGRRMDGPRGGMPLDAMRELARAGTPRLGGLTTSAWWSSAIDRVGEVAEAGARGRFEDALRRLGAYGGSVPLPLGLWHGDWTPWNMAWDGSRVLLWDWEHLADDVPIGFDAVHYLAQRLRVAEGTGPVVEQRWLREVEHLASDWLSLDPAQRSVLVLAYLVEVNLRFVLDRQSTSDHRATRSGWGLDLMSDRARRLAVPPQRRRQVDA